MAEVTASSMHDARDAENIRLLAAGEHGALIESYFEIDHIASVDLSRIGESVRMLTWGEQMDVDRALKLVLGLAG